MKRLWILASLACVVAVGVICGSGGVPQLVTPALASSAAHVLAASNTCPQYSYSHPYCTTVPNAGCFQVHVIGELITLEGCEPTHGHDAGHHITTSPIDNPCPTVPGGPNHAGAFVLRADGSFTPLRLKTPPPPGGKLYVVMTPGSRGPGACTPTSAVTHAGEYEVVYPGARLATTVKHLKRKSHRKR